MMDEKQWCYYNHAMIPRTPPHQELYVSETDIQKLLNCNNRGGGGVLLVRWTTDFDCGHETNWWYCIKDEPFDIASINSKKRYEINKGKKNFDVKVIDPANYVDEICDVTVAAYQSWPEKYRPKPERVSLKKEIASWENKVIIAAFTKRESKLVGYAYIAEYDNYAEFNMLRVNPEYEKYAVNAAIINEILAFYSERLTKDFYILDGARSINHETAFQDYLEKYFKFRKAYCKLHVAYSSKIKWVIKTAYPFRNLLKSIDNVSMVHKLNSLLKMEEIQRE